MNKAKDGFFSNSRSLFTPAHKKEVEQMGKISKAEEEINHLLQNKPKS